VLGHEADHLFRERQAPVASRFATEDEYVAAVNHHEALAQARLFELRRAMAQADGRPLRADGSDLPEAGARIYFPAYQAAHDAYLAAHPGATRDAHRAGVDAGVDALRARWGEMPVSIPGGGTYDAYARQLYRTRGGGSATRQTQPGNDAQPASPARDGQVDPANHTPRRSTLPGIGPQGPQAGAPPFAGPGDVYAVLGANRHLTDAQANAFRESRLNTARIEAVLDHGVSADDAALAALQGHDTFLALERLLANPGAMTPATAAALALAAGDRGFTGSLEMAARNGAAQRLVMAPGMSPTAVVDHLARNGAPGVQLLDYLLRAPNMTLARAEQILAQAARTGDPRGSDSRSPLAIAARLAASGNVANPAQLIEAINTMRRELDTEDQFRGLPPQVRPVLGGYLAVEVAAEQAAQGRLVSFEAQNAAPQGRADVIARYPAPVTEGGRTYHGEAIQMKASLSSDSQHSWGEVVVAVSQLRGQRGETPPAGYRRVVDLRLYSRQQVQEVAGRVGRRTGADGGELYMMTREQLVASLRAYLDLQGRAVLQEVADARGAVQPGDYGWEEIRITNGRGRIHPPITPAELIAAAPAAPAARSSSAERP
jgi:hypothetical protein